ncbi:MAG: NAD-dependent deacetylase [Acidobacteriota bacterium]
MRYSPHQAMKVGRDRIAEIARKLAEARRVSILTGAGVSAESGVPTFRGPEGLWRKFRPEELATPEAFARDPRLVWEWYDWRRQKVASCRPNRGHEALAGIEPAFEDFTLVTQNVDGLHRAAGSRRVCELHGNIWILRCTGCHRREEDRRTPLLELPPRCRCGSLLRPDVVWFGEALPAEPLSRSVEAMRRCQLLLVVGTSALVHPAGSLPVLAKQSGALVVEVNRERTPLSGLADATLLGPSATFLPELCRGAGLL